MSPRRGEREPRGDPRLAHLYEISKLFASFENAQQTLDLALGVVGRSIPLRSAILIEADVGHSTMIVWPSQGQDKAQLRTARQNAEKAYSYLIGAPEGGSLQFSEQAGATILPLQAIIEGDLIRRCLVIPLVVARRPPFGVLQLEGARPLGKADLMFVNAIANQLAIALDRNRAWRRDIDRGDQAEEQRLGAVERGAAAERERVIAEHLREKYELLAQENAALYEQAQVAVRLREQILGIVSHDLRNPIQAILMSVGILAHGAKDEDQQAALPQAIARIQRASKRMLRLIEDLLDFASIQAGRLAIKRELQDSGAILQEVLANFEGFEEEKKLRLTAEVEPDLPQAYCDHDRILQVLSNLVGNAIKATDQGGQVTLRVEDRGHELLFAVKDDGPGFSEEDAKHLFERYWRSDDSGYKGTGLGLAIAQGIVNAHGGRIWAESEPGHGSTFFFTVPAPDDRRHVTRRSGEPLTPTHA